MIDRKLAPKIIDAIDFDFNLAPCNHNVFQNNVPLYWVSAGNIDVVAIDWVFSAGLWDEPKPAIASTVAELLRSGTKTKTALQINEAIEYYGATVRTAVDNDFSTISLYCLTKHLPNLLPLIREIIENAIFPDDEWILYKQRYLQKLSINLEKADFVANRVIDELIFSKAHPYGRYIEVSDLESIKPTDLKNFAQTHYGSMQCKIFMGGKVDQKEVSLLEQYFGREKWGGEFKPLQSAEAHSSNDKSYRKTISKTPMQGSIRVARALPHYSHPDFIGLTVLNTVFGGYFGSRLMNNIREEKGYTYGIYSGIYGLEHGSEMIIHTDAEVSVCEETVKEIFKEMDNLRNHLITEAELLLVKNYLLGGLLGDLDGAFSIIKRWKSMILKNRDIEDFNQSVSVYKNIQSSELQNLALKYYNRDEYYNAIIY